MSVSAIAGKRPTSITVISVLNLWNALLLFILGIMIFAAPVTLEQSLYIPLSQISSDIATGVGICLIVTSLVFIASAIGILNRLDWTRYLLITFSGLLLLSLILIFAMGGSYFDGIPDSTVMVLVILLMVLLFALGLCSVVFLLLPSANDYFHPPKIIPPKPTTIQKPILKPKPALAIAWLLVKVGPEKGREFRLSRDKPEFLIGTQPECDFRLSDNTVSRKHAKIKWDEGVFILFDLGSTNYTLVNGSRIQRHQLADGDEISMGNTKVFFSFPPSIS